MNKYKPGDVVRTKCGKVFTIGRIDVDGHYIMREPMDSCWTESYLSPFDGFRIGDTVWTVKRGKGKIVASSYRLWACHEERPFQVDFECGKTRYPKHSNLIPTEAKMKEATEPKPDLRLILADKKLAQLRETLDGIYKLAESNKLRFDTQFTINNYPSERYMDWGFLPSFKEGKKTIDLTVTIN